MSKQTTMLRTISRRDTLKAVLLPAAGALGAQWLQGCNDDKMQMSQPQGEAAASPASAVGAKSGAGGGSTSAGAGANAVPAISVAGSPAHAGASGSTKAAGGAGAGPTPHAAGAPGGAGGAGIAGSSAPAGSSASAGAAAGAGGSARTGVGGNSGVAGASVMWATGGTKSMQGGYPDPFMSGMGGTPCMVYPSQTLGPCYAQSPMVREDISDGMTGLPVRLSLLVVRANGCMPVVNATIDIWHSGFNGVYSAYATGTICNPGTQNVMNMMYCRGVQTTDANGRANFNTIFPGWYTGRSIHIHFTVRVDGRESKTSQLYFEDPLTDEILAQGEYAARGKRDTTNASDMIFRSGGATAASVVMSAAKRPDGVLHAWKVLAIM